MSKRARLTLALALAGALVTVLGIAFVIHPQRVAERERVQQAEDFLANTDAAIRTLGYCISGAQEPSEFGRGLNERLRTRERESFAAEIGGCLTTFNLELRSTLPPGLSPPPPSLAWSDDHGPEGLCSSFALIEATRDAWVAELGLVRYRLPNTDCWGPRVEARTLDTLEESLRWRTYEHESGGLVISSGPLDERRHGWVEPERGVVTWLETREPAFAGLELPLQVAGSQALLLGERLVDELQLARWREVSGKPQPPELQPLDIPAPSVFTATPERWFFVSEAQGQLDIRFSDDAGQTMTTRTLALAHADANAARPWSHASGKQLMLALDRGAALVLVRVDAAGEVRSSELALDSSRDGQRSLDACGDASGAIAVLDGHLVLHLGDTPKLVEDLAPARVLALACVDARAFVAIHDGTSLQRRVCDEAGCDDPVLLAHDGRREVALRSNGGGVHVLVLGEPIDFHLVDQPLGGPLERVERLVRKRGVTDGPITLDELPVHVDGVLIAKPRTTQDRP